ncbi:MAG: hypothetical protein WHT27_05590 [candidate division WOR-3 bacterium]|jgi:type III secretory pathway component EscU
MKTVIIYSLLFFILFSGFLSSLKSLLPDFESLNQSDNFNKHYTNAFSKMQDEGGIECLTLSCIAGFVVGAMIVYAFQI